MTVQTFLSDCVVSLHFALWVFVRCHVVTCLACCYLPILPCSMLCGSPRAHLSVSGAVSHVTTTLPTRGLFNLRLNRQHRLTAWRAFDEPIWCEAFRAYIGRCRQQLSLEDASMEAACPRPACQGQPEALTHLFLTCPSSARVWTWLKVFRTQPQWQPGPSTVSSAAHGS